MEVEIRPMLEGDLEDILEIEGLCFASPWSRASFLFEINSNPLSKYFVASLDGRPVGYAGIWIVIDESHVTNICVRPDARGKKIGSLLFDRIVRLSRDLGLASMTLEVRKSNLVAQSLYTSFGFREVGLRPSYYQDNGEDAILMLKEFKDV